MNSLLFGAAKVSLNFAVSQRTLCV